jgi:hypothetical protein
MHNVTLALQGAWKVLAASLILGAGLPIIFALGIRSLAWGSGGEAEVHTTGVSGPKANRPERSSPGSSSSSCSRVSRSVSPTSLPRASAK